MIYSRRVYEVVSSRIQDEPVILLHGPRSVGKSTLLQQLAVDLKVPVMDLDDPVIRDAVIANPNSAVKGSTPLLMDEYQLANGVLDALKARLNVDGSRPGMR